MMKLRLRKFTPSDTADLLGLFYDTVHEVNRKDYSEEQCDAWAPSRSEGLGMWRERFASSKTVVAFTDKRIVGFGNLEKSRSGIDMLYVLKDFQGKGVASILLKKLEKKLRKRDVAVASLEASITARPFFEKRGYRVIHENRKMLNGQEFINFIMEKNLKKKEKKMKKKDKADKKFTWFEWFTNKWM